MTGRQQAKALRVAVYRLLAEDGVTAAEAGRRLKKRSDTIAYHVRCLRESGAIKRQSTGFHSEREKFYEPGPRAALFLAKVGNGNGHKIPEKRDQGVWSETEPPVRLHRGHRGFPVLASPEDPRGVAGYESTKTLSKVENHYYRHVDGEGRKWRMRFVAGQKRQSVVAYPPSRLIEDNDEVATAEEWWPNWVMKEALRWAGQTGFTLDKDKRQMRDTAPIEGGIPVRMQRFGTPATDKVYVDGSLGEGQPGELEASPRMIAALRRSADHQEATDLGLASVRAKLDVVEEQLMEQHSTLEQIARIQVKIAKNGEANTKVLARQVLPDYSPEVV